MGRLFVTKLEEPVYRCKNCQLEIALYEPNLKFNPPFKYSGNVGKLYCILKCYNVVIGTDKETFTINGQIDNTMFKVYCIACSSLVGLYYEAKDDDDIATKMYNEGNFYINRFKLHGPPGESDDDDENPE